MALRKKKALSALIASTMVASAVPAVEIKPAAMTGLILPAAFDKITSWAWDHKMLTATGFVLTIGGTHYVMTKTGFRPLNKGLLAALGIGPYKEILYMNKCQLIEEAVAVRDGSNTALHVDWRHLTFLADSLGPNAMLDCLQLYRYFARCDHEGKSDGNPDFSDDALKVLKKLVIWRKETFKDLKELQVV